MKIIYVPPNLNSKYADIVGQYTQYKQTLSIQQNLFISLYHPEVLLFCDVCQLSLEGQVSIICTLKSQNMSSNPLFNKSDSKKWKDIKSKRVLSKQDLLLDLCPKCFCKALLSPSLQEDYQVRTKDDYSLTSSRWRVRDEILFLKNIEKFLLIYFRFNYQNWDLIEKEMLMGRCKIDKKFYKSHFESYYFINKDKISNSNVNKTKKIPLNDQTIEWVNLGSNVPLKYRQKKNPIQLPKCISLYKQQSSQNQQRSLNSEKSTIKNSKENFNSVSDKLSCEKIIVGCYSPERDQFLVQYDPYAESLIADLEFRDDDSEQEILMKRNMLLTYNSRLRERQRRKKVLKQFNAIPYNRINQEKDSDLIVSPLMGKQLIQQYKKQAKKEDFVSFRNSMSKANNQYDDIEFLKTIEIFRKYLTQSDFNECLIQHHQIRELQNIRNGLINLNQIIIKQENQQKLLKNNKINKTENKVKKKDNFTQILEQIKRIKSIRKDDSSSWQEGEMRLMNSNQSSSSSKKSRKKQQQKNRSESSQRIVLQRSNNYKKGSLLFEQSHIVAMKAELMNQMNETDKQISSTLENAPNFDNNQDIKLRKIARLIFDYQKGYSLKYE